MNYLKIRSETNRVTSSFSLKSNSERISYLADEEKKRSCLSLATLMENYLSITKFFFRIDVTVNIAIAYFMGIKYV